MIDRSEKRDGAAQRAHPRPADLSPKPVVAPASPDFLTLESVAGIQRAAGNASVTELVATPGPPELAPTRPGPTAGAPAAAPATTGEDRRAAPKPVISPQIEAGIRTDIDHIVQMLKESYWNAEEQEEVLGVVRHYAALDDDYRATSGYPGSEYLDRFLFFLKTRTFTSSSLTTMWVDQSYNAYDEIWRMLDDAGKAEFKTLNGRSKKWGSTGPEGPEHENPWATIGHQELMGGWGLLKGLGTGLAGMADAGAWAVTKGLRATGLDVADPMSVSKWIGEQFDESGDIMFGKDWKGSEKLLGRMNAGEIGSFGGGIVWSLTMMGAGGAGGTAGKALGAFGVASALKGVEDSANKIADLILKMQERGELTAANVLTSGEFWMASTELAASVFSAMAGAKGLAAGEEASQAMKATKESLERTGLLIEGTKLSAKAGRLTEIYLSDLTDEKKKEAGAEVIKDLISTSVSMVGTKAAAIDAKRAEAAKYNEEVEGKQWRDLSAEKRAQPLELATGPQEWQGKLPEYGLRELPAGKEPSLELANQPAGPKATSEPGAAEILKGVDTDEFVDKAFEEGGSARRAEVKPIDRKRPMEVRPDIEGNEPAQFVPRETVAAVKEVLGESVANDQTRAAWERAANEVRADYSGGPIDQAVMNEQMYPETQRKFWQEVHADGAARGYFESHGFVFDKPGNAPLIDGYQTYPKKMWDEFRVSLDHTLPKAKGDNWQHALDAEHLQFVTHADNTMLQNLEKRHPELGRP